MRIIFAFVSCCCLGIALSISTKIIKEPLNIARAVTQNLTVDNPFNGDIGQWGPIVACVDGSFAVAFEVKYNPPGHLDETAVNSVKLYCAQPDGQDTGYIESTVGPHGSYYGMRLCVDAFITGFRANTLEDQGIFTDDVAVEDIEMDCDYGREIITSGIPPMSKKRQNPKPYNFGVGEWSAFATCNEGTAVCAIQTRYEDSALGDEAAICEVVMFCCDMPVSQTTPATLRKL